MTKKTEPLRSWPVGVVQEGEKLRPFRAEDWLGKRIRCPHCGRLLMVMKAEGPYLGNDPSENFRDDCYWVLTLSDGETARMWEDRKGVIEPVGGSQ
jgi:hypothetical protein